MFWGRNALGPALGRRRHPGLRDQAVAQAPGPGPRSARASPEARAQDIRVDYSFALVLAHYNRYEEAQQLFDQIAASGKGQTRRHARLARAWLLTAEAHDRPALSELNSLAELLAADKQDSAEYVDAGRTCGILLGYLEAADREKLTAGEISAAKDCFRQSLATKAGAAFEEGLAHVARRHSELKQSLDDRKARETQEVEAKRNKEESELGAAKKQVDDSRKDLDAAKAEQDDKYRKDVNQLEASAAKWQVAYQTSLNAANQVQAQLANLQAQRPSCFRLVEDKNGRREEIIDVGRLATIDAGINQLSAQLGPLQARVAQLSAEGQVLMQQRQAVEGRAFAEASQTAQKEHRLSATEARIAGRTKGLEHLHASSAGSARLKTDLAALKSYLEFPYDAEVARLRKSLK